MKALVLSITAGQGHNSTAKAICDYFESIGVEAKMLDTYSYLNKLLGKTVANGYLLSVETARGAYARTYRHLEKRRKTGDDKSATRTINSLLTPKIKRFIDSYSPDVIICTHIFACMIVDILKQKGEISAKTIGILTDFAFHPYWEESIHFDYIVTANEMLLLQARKKGFSDSQVLPIGIPINPKFIPDIPKDDARRMLGIDPDKITVMLMSGSMGYGNIAETISLLESVPYDFQIVAVCGSNAKAKARIDAMTHQKPILCLGFANNIEVIMSASDCIITKPGGLSTSEALAKELPMIIIDPIPGQEDRNTEFLLNNGVAISVTDTFPLDEALFELFSNKDRLENMRRSAKLLKKPDSTVKLCEFAQEIVK